MDICQDSLELPRPLSKLIEYTEVREGEDKPRQVFMPVFFRTTRSPSHQRQGSLNPVLNGKKSNLSEILLSLREKPKPKSSLKNPEGSKKQKTVSFCSLLEMSSPEALTNSVIYLGEKTEKEICEDSLEQDSNKSEFTTTANSLNNEHIENKPEKIPDTATSTQQNLELREESEEEPQSPISFEEAPRFPFEEEVRSSMGNREIEFNEFSTVAFCEKCDKEIVTAVSFEKVKGEGCGSMTEWILCWALPACMYRKKKLIHKCPNCGFDIAKFDW